MRVFVALACPESLTEEVRRYQALLKDVDGVHLLDAEGLHMTVIPPWEEKDPDAVVRDFAAVDEPALRLAIDDAACRQVPGKSGVAWLGASSTPDAERLWLKSYRAVLSHDPARAALPHVSIARFPAEAELPDLPAIEPREHVFDRLCLYESRGDRVYRVIGERKLAL